MKDLRSKEWEAQAAAYEEAAEHLAQHWTDDILEREQGFILANEFQRKAEELYAKSSDSLRIAGKHIHKT